MAKVKRKTGLGETNGGIAITFERVLLYGLGFATIGGIVYFAKTMFDKNQAKLDKYENAQAGITTSGAAGTNVTQTSTNPNPNPSPAIAQPPEITIPAISPQRFWGGVKNTPTDEFPLRYGQGGFRVSALHQALKKLGLGIQDPTGYFGNITQNIIKANLGKVTVTEAEFVNFLKLAKMTGREDLSLNGLENSVLGHLGLI